MTNLETLYSIIRSFNQEFERVLYPQSVSAEELKNYVSAQYGVFLKAKKIPFLECHIRHLVLADLLSKGGFKVHLVCSVKKSFTEKKISTFLLVEVEDKFFKFTSANSGRDKVFEVDYQEIAQNINSKVVPFFINPLNCWYDYFCEDSPEKFLKENYNFSLSILYAQKLVILKVKNRSFFLEKVKTRLLV